MRGKANKSNKIFARRCNEQAIQQTVSGTRLIDMRDPTTDNQEQERQHRA